VRFDGLVVRQAEYDEQLSFIGEVER